MIGREDEVRPYRARIKTVYSFVVVMLGFIVARLVFLQIIKGDELKKYSEANRLKKEKLLPSRGIIFDRSGKIIVDNRAAFDVVLLSQYYPFEKDINQALARALAMSDTDFELKLQKISRSPTFAPILMKADVPRDVLAAVDMQLAPGGFGFPGIDIEYTVQRRYPYGETAAQLLGYISEVDQRDIKTDPQKQLLAGDYIGKMGIEREFDSFLRGQNGVGYVEVDAYGRRKKSESSERLLGFVSQTDPIPGKNIYLTLDADVEAAAAEAMKSRQYQGTVIAMDPRNGEVLAMVNSPSYNPAAISGRDINVKMWSELRNNKDRPLRNRAVQDHYPPGSTFKLFVAIAGLAEGVISTRSTVNCNGSFRFGKRTFNCWQKRGHGVTDFFKAIRESCDVFFYQLGNQLGVDTIAKYARLFGFGKPTGVMKGEAKGLIPDSVWKQKNFNDIWHPGETISIAIGQGFIDVTPIQLVAAYSAIANGGFLYKPFIVKKIEGFHGESIQEFQPELIRKIEIPNDIFDAVKEGLFQVVNAPHGTASSAKSKLTVLSGKTGTAQVRGFADVTKVKCAQIDYYDRHHGLFVGFAPKENPQIAVVAIAEHSCHSIAAAHVVKDVVDAYFTKQRKESGQPIEEEPPVLTTEDESLEKEPPKKIVVKRPPKKEPPPKAEGDEEDQAPLPQEEEQ